MSKRRSLSRGNSTAQKIAGEATSNPHAEVLPIDLAASAPIRVDRFQNTYTPIPVYQNAVRWSARSCWAIATPVDSSMVTCAPRIFFKPFSFRMGAIRTPYRPLRPPRNAPVMIALKALPPALMTATSENWDAPEKRTRESTQACATVKWLDTATAPNATPAAPTASPTLMESRFTDTPIFCLNTKP